MAVTTTDLNNPIGAKIIQDDQSNATSENNVNAGAATLHVVDGDNTLNSAASFLKLYNNSTATASTSVPDAIIKLPPGKRIAYLPASAGQGNVFSSGLSFLTVTTGGTDGSTSPANNVVVRIFIS